MKKIFKILGIIFGTLLLLFVIMLIIGPSDVVVLTPEEEAEENRKQEELYADVDLSGFDTVAITGETVTSDYFSGYDITMINLWTTNCSPCIEEMPDIASLHKSRPEGSNIISICVDTVDDEKAVELAVEIMEDSGAEFLTLIPDEILQKELTDRTMLFPTTIFVDSKGRVVGAPYQGGRSEEDYREEILRRIEML